METSSPPPRIAPVTDGAPRPFWSVMVPVYNPTPDYLAQALRSVLDQAPEPDGMQLEVVDDGSPQPTAEAVLRQLASPRVTLYRQPQNLGLAGNWNACLSRARGLWVHLLHQDDWVRPGFYAHLRAGLTAANEARGAFCRHAFVDAAGRTVSLSAELAREAGVLPGLLEVLAEWTEIQTPSIVVRREAYERSGGFRPDLAFALDWEMWVRLAADGPLWYEPEPLACYRVHAGSTTSRLARGAEDSRDIRRVIELNRARLPAGQAGRLTRAAYGKAARYARRQAQRLQQAGDWEGARAQAYQALCCATSFGEARKALLLLLKAGLHQ